MWSFFPTGERASYKCDPDFYRAFNHVCVTEPTTLLVLVPRKYDKDSTATLENIVWEVWHYQGHTNYGLLLHTKEC